jgi:hypothetical protein
MADTPRLIEKTVAPFLNLANLISADAGHDLCFCPGVYSVESSLGIRPDL